MENLGPMMGILFTGIVAGWLTMYFIRRLNNYTTKGISAIIATVFGAVIINFLNKGEAYWWLYPIGLFLGIAIYIILAVMAGAPLEGVVYGKIESPPDE